eukprot:TRINITY_DN24150_c0_g1_i9.p1 TRINITY_DN24150_c0_g1~~TRINITY_DN24150_c0_g1_i9.p1  ORF type:complete len:182 (-),score=17.22 TRINITY_DN24150_c0_g1_i9:9-554(-)
MRFKMMSVMRSVLNVKMSVMRSVHFLLVPNCKTVSVRMSVKMPVKMNVKMPVTRSAMMSVTMGAGAATNIYIWRRLGFSKEPGRGKAVRIKRRWRRWQPCIQRWKDERRGAPLPMRAPGASWRAGPREERICTNADETTSCTAETLDASDSTRDQARSREGCPRKAAVAAQEWTLYPAMER